MNAFKLSVMLLFLGCAWLPKALVAQGSASVMVPDTVVVRTAHWMGYTEPDFSGFYFDLVRHVFTESEYNLDLKIVSFPASLKMLEGGAADIIMGVYNSEVSKAYFSELPVEREMVAAAMTAERAATWQGAKSLENLRVGSIEGYAFEGRLPISAKYAEFDSIAFMLRMLQAGRLDIVLDYRPDIEYFMEKMDLSFVIKEDLPQTAVYFAFHKNPRGLALKRYFDKRFRELLESGRVWELMLNALGEEDTIEAFPFVCESGKCSVTPNLLKH